MQDDPDWAPCINLGYPRQGPTDRKRYERATQLEEKRRRYECAEALLALSKITDALDTSAGTMMMVLFWNLVLMELKLKLN